MNTHVALLYSVVLTPERRVVMVDLKAMAEDLGFVAPRTLGASGNLIFEAPGRMPVGTIEQKLEPAFAADFHDAGSDAERARVVVDQVASLTDQTAVDWHNRLVGDIDPAEVGIWTPRHARPRAAHAGRSTSAALLATDGGR